MTMHYPVKLRERQFAFIDDKGHIALKIESDNAFGALDPFAFIKRKEKLLIINDAGETVNELRGDVAGRFINGHAVIGVLDRRGSTPILRKGLIDSSGRWICPPKFYEVSDVREGCFAVRETDDKLLSLCSLDGRVLLPSFAAVARPISEELAIGVDPTVLRGLPTS